MTLVRHTGVFSDLRASGAGVEITGGSRSSCWWAKQGSGGCAPQRVCRGGEESLLRIRGRSHPEAAVLMHSVYCQKRLREYHNVKNSFVSLDLFSLAFKNIFLTLWEGGDRPRMYPPLVETADVQPA